MNIMKLIKYIGQPFCIVLYIGGIILTIKKKPIGLISLIACHLSEYFIIGKDVERGANGFFKCLAFGFTWWLPAKKEKEQNF